MAVEITSRVLKLARLSDGTPRLLLIAVNTLEFLEYLAAGQPVLDDPSKLRCDIPPIFENMADEIKRGAYRTLVKTGADLRELAAELKLDRDRIRSEWPKWIKVQKVLAPSTVSRLREPH